MHSTALPDTFFIAVGSINFIHRNQAIGLNEPKFSRIWNCRLLSPGLPANWSGLLVCSRCCMQKLVSVELGAMWEPTRKDYFERSTTVPPLEVISLHDAPDVCSFTQDVGANNYIHDITELFSLSNGCSYILTCIDKRWIETIPITALQIESVVHAIFNGWFALFYVFSVITIDKRL